MQFDLEAARNEHSKSIYRRPNGSKQENTKPVVHFLIKEHYKKKKELLTNLLPEISISLIATPIDGSINKVVRALTRIDAESELMPMFERRT